VVKIAAKTRQILPEDTEVYQTPLLSRHAALARRLCVTTRWNTEPKPRPGFCSWHGGGSGVHLWLCQDCKKATSCLCAGLQFGLCGLVDGFHLHESAATPLALLPGPQRDGQSIMMTHIHEVGQPDALKP
jgi:hypothetical protein